MTRQGMEIEIVGSLYVSTVLEREIVLPRL